MRSQFLIGAAASGSGKTTITLGLMRAFVLRGLVVRPFKCGPDYIDPLFHRLAAERDSINLDLWMASERHVRGLFARYGQGADACVVEGAMGLLDGWSRAAGSASEVARTLDLPVILVVDAQRAAYSVAATLYGFRHFCPSLAGVIFNRVGSAAHYDFLRTAARDAGVEPLGWLPRREDFSAPERHLGLSLENLDAFSPTIDAIADALEHTVDLDRLLELTLRPEPAETPAPKPAETPAPPSLRVAVARDEAFNFLYRANLDRLEELGARLDFFSPLRDAAPPPANLIYLPGGYPEFFAAELSANAPMRRAIRDHAEKGGKILAECGGMLYLCRALDGHPMCGVLPLSGTMEGARLHLGYREIRHEALTIRGHEFHYSHTTGERPSIAKQFSAQGREVATPLYRHKNVIAGYTHFYWAEGDPTQLFEL